MARLKVEWCPHATRVRFCIFVYLLLTVVAKVGSDDWRRQQRFCTGVWPDVVCFADFLLSVLAESGFRLPKIVYARQYDKDGVFCSVC